MKKFVTRGIALATAAMMLAGCAGSTGNEESSSLFEARTDEEAIDTTVENSTATSSEASSTEETSDQETESAEQTTGVSICDETTVLDYSKDYEEEIKVAVERAVAESNSYDDEFVKISEIEDHISSRRSDEESQADMNMAAGYFFKVWDCEMNNLWDRFVEQADAETKERVEADQKNWNDMKEEAALEALGSREEGGSIYPVLYNDFMENSTKTRCYAIAKELAAINGSSFTMPEKNFDGMYIDNQGTGSIYGSLVIKSGWETGFDATISIYRVGALEGSVEENGQGALNFASFDDAVKGVITYSWDGATFEVTEVNGDAIVSVGDVYEFPVIF